MNNQKRFKKYVLIAVAIIVENICVKPLDDITTGELAQQFNISRKLLQVAFREIVGMGIKEYRNMKRMEMAQQLLADGNKSIKEIARTCLYKSQSAFTTAFKKMYGITPSEWQEHNQV
jgi:AraC-type DNA-binding domain-containing proteins